MAKLSPDAVRLVRDAAEAERAVGSQKLATALELLVEWHDRQSREPVAAPPAPASRAAVDVLAERHRQVAVRGFDAAHDDAQGFRPLAEAAISYAMCGARRTYARAASPPMWWPWSADLWEPKDPRADLVRFVALGLAALEAFDRLTETDTHPEPGGRSS